MEIAICLILLLSLSGAAMSVLLIKRNDKVLRFRIWIIELTIKSTYPNKALDVFNVVSYEKMLYCFWKKLELDSFYTDEQLKIMLE